MPEPQCNTCGGFSDIVQCPHCSTMTCRQCQLRHVSLCEELQKRKKRGEGPTIANVPQGEHRRGHETPPTTPAPRPTAELAELARAIMEDAGVVLPNGDTVIAYSIQDTRTFVDGQVNEPGIVSLPSVPESIDAGLDAVKGLLGEE